MHPNINRGRECQRAPKRYGPVREHKVAEFVGYGKPAARHSGPTYGFMHGSLFLRFFQPIAQGKVPNARTRMSARNFLPLGDRRSGVL